MNCYCQSGQKLSDCCAPFIQGQRLPSTAEQLMRSRFSAYCDGSANAMQYLADSYHPLSQADNPMAEISAFAKAAHFVRLEVINASDELALPENLRYIAEGTNHDQVRFATVHFKVQFIMHDKLHLLDEVSRFIRTKGRWSYLDGTLVDTSPLKLSRNESCPCRSGKKYKHCQQHLFAG